MNNDVISAVGLSTKWNAEEAGVEVANDLRNRMRGVSPDFILLFSTIHYRTRGGFAKLLEAVYSVFPRGTPLIGGTVAGFIIPQGCFAHGVAAFGLKSEGIDFAVAMAKNTKRDPKAAALSCAKEIGKALSGSKFENRFLLTLPSGITTPKIPGFPENQRVIRSKILSMLLQLGIKLSEIILQKGPGREEAIIETLAAKLPDFKMIGGSFVDDNKGYYNFQFYNGEVGTNMLVALGIATNYDISVNSNFGLTERSEKFHITSKSTYDMIIEEINGKNAFDEMLTILRWPHSFLEDNARILRRTFYAPIGYLVDGKRYTSTMAFIFGNGIMISPKVRCEEACIMTASGRQLVDVVDLNLEDTRSKSVKFGFIVSCIARLETLGAASYKVHEKLVKHFKDRPFFEIYTVGEDVYTQEYGAKRMTTSYNTAIFFE